MKLVTLTDPEMSLDDAIAEVTLYAKAGFWTSVTLPTIVKEVAFRALPSYWRLETQFEDGFRVFVPGLNEKFVEQVHHEICARMGWNRAKASPGSRRMTVWRGEDGLHLRTPLKKKRRRKTERLKLMAQCARDAETFYEQAIKGRELFVEASRKVVHSPFSGPNVKGCPFCNGFGACPCKYTGVVEEDSGEVRLGLNIDTLKRLQVSFDDFDPVFFRLLPKDEPAFVVERKYAHELRRHIRRSAVRDISERLTCIHGQIALV